MSAKAESRFGRMINDFEETLIAVLLGLMTLITFANVIARYVFNSNILWALEATVFLFAWLVLIGASYCVKISARLGVDVILNMASPPMRRILVLISAACCIVFSVLLLIGAWQYWLPFAGKNAWYEVNDIPMIGFLRFIEGWINEGEAYEKLQAGFGAIIFLVIVNVILLIGGQFMEPSGLIVIVAPLVFPIAIKLGIDPIHLGIIMVVNMKIGMITPPVGLNLFVTSGVAGMSLIRVVKAALPGLAILFVFLIMVTYIPWLSAFRPTLLLGPEIIAP